MILGSYSNAQGNRIYLNLAGNIENQSMFGTVQHEAGHALLTGCTVLGTLQHIMYMEALASEDTDRAYSLDRATCARLLGERTRSVQEVYANNFELLALEKQLGREEMLHALKNKPKAYQDFYMEMMPVHRSGLSCREKMQCISGLCAYAMNVPVPQQAVCDYKSLALFLSGEQDSHWRLKYAVACYEKDGTVPEETMDEAELLRIAEKAAVYVKLYLREAVAHLDDFPGQYADQSANEIMDELIMKQICLFDPSKIRPKRIQRLAAADVHVCLLFKQVQDALEEACYDLIGYGETYVREEVRETEFCKQIAQYRSICILASALPYYEETVHKLEKSNVLLTVILQTSEECAPWLREEKENGTVYIGEFNIVCKQTDVSILFFRRRESPRRLYVFPTLRVIRNYLLRAFQMENNCRQADEEDFLALLSCLGDELDMLKYLHGLLPLLLGHSKETLRETGAFQQMCIAVERNLLDHAIQIKRSDYYQLMAALPQKETTAAPLFTLMRFDGDKNTGDTYLDANAKAPLLFSTKEAADDFASRYAKSYTGVGIDQVYWPFFCEMIRSKNGKVVLVLKVAQMLGKLVSIEDVASVWYR